ncbi:MAG: hypothetical protein Q8880_05480 [Bacteroidota bacterium]|nr:hypothetical protein [Bacteroidota bacterium]
MINSEEIKKFAKESGADLCGIVSIDRYDYWDVETMTGKGILSLKHLGYKAGLGYIGRNSLLCNDKYGNLIRLGAVITDVEMVADDLMEGDMCSDSCNLCINSCPVGAIGIDGIVLQRNCREHAEIKNKRGVDIYACCECRRVCPNMNGIGNKY